VSAPIKITRSQALDIGGTYRPAPLSPYVELCAADLLGLTVAVDARGGITSAKLNGEPAGAHLAFLIADTIVQVDSFGLAISMPKGAPASLAELLVEAIRLRLEALETKQEDQTDA
jgi:hypothetical protein